MEDNIKGGFNPDDLVFYQEAGKIMNINVLDHIIVLPNGDYTSFADNNEL